MAEIHDEEDLTLDQWLRWKAIDLAVHNTGPHAPVNMLFRRAEVIRSYIESGSIPEPGNGDPHATLSEQPQGPGSD